MTRAKSKCLHAVLASALLTTGLVGTASADCLRRVSNRSAYVLVGHQDTGAGFVLRPGRSATVRLARPGRFDLTAYCSPVDRLGRPMLGGREAARLRIDYEAVLDRCYMKIGDGFFETALGPGFAGTQDTAPFTVNNPRQGDIVLGRFNAACTAAD